MHFGFTLKLYITLSILKMYFSPVADWQVNRWSFEFSINLDEFVFTHAMWSLVCDHLVMCLQWSDHSVSFLVYMFWVLSACGWISWDLELIIFSLVFPWHSQTELIHGNRGTMAMFTQQNNMVVSPVWSVKYDSLITVHLKKTDTL